MFFKRSIIASTIMLSTMLILSRLSAVEDVYPHKPLSDFPKQIDRWIGREERFNEYIYDKLGVDDSFLADYRSSEGGHVQLYVGFYRSQREGDIIHSPRNCMPGSGWNIIQSSLEELAISDNNHGMIKVVKLILEKEGQRQIVLYWFQSRGRFITSEYMQKVYLIVDSVMQNRTDGSFIRLIAPVSQGKESKVLEDIKDFARLVIPVLQRYLPS